MNLSEIRTECWEQARDDAIADADRLWPEEEMNRYINRICRDIARKTHCIMDLTTPAVCIISMDPVDYTTYTAGTLDYIWANDPENWLYQLDVTPYLFDLHASILQVENVKVVSEPRNLTEVSVEKWKTNPWWERTVGPTITEYALDAHVGKLAVNYRLESSDTLQLDVTRLPLTDLVNDDDTPEFRVNYHDYIKPGVMALMYDKEDADALNPKKAAQYKGEYAEGIDIINMDIEKYRKRLNPNHSMDAFR